MLNRAQQVGDPLEEVSPPRLSDRLDRKILLRCPFPVFKIDLSGDIFWHNDPGKRLIEGLGALTPEAIFPTNHCQLIKQALRSNKTKITESTLQERTFQWHYVPFSERNLLTVFVIEITEYAQMIGGLEHELGLDHQTRFYNLRYFERELRKNLELAAKDPKFAFALLGIDINDFKRFNDEDGTYALGNEVIEVVGNATNQAIRAGDVCARLMRGDEFGVILQGLRRDATSRELRPSAEIFVQKIRTSIAGLPQFGANPKTITASMTVLLCSGKCGTAQELYRLLESKMFDAKHAPDQVLYVDLDKQRENVRPQDR